MELTSIVKKRISDKVLLLCIRPAGQSGWLYTEPAYVLDHITEGEAGDEWELKYVLMTQAEVDALPEFDGW